MFQNRILDKLILKRVVPILLVTLIFFINCGKESDNPKLATFKGGFVQQNDYIDHYLQSTQYKPDVLPNEENLKTIVKQKASEKLAVLEAVAQKMDRDSMFLALGAKNELKILFEKYMRLFVVDSVVTDSLVQKYYNEFSPQYRMRYIIRPVLKTSTTEFEQSQSDTIEHVHRLLQQGKNFEDIANKYSQDITTNRKGGDLGWVIRESLGDAVLRSVMDTLKAFSYSTPVRGYEGYYILYKGESREVAVPPFEEAQPRIWKGLSYNRQHIINDILDEKFKKIAPTYNYLVNEDVYYHIIEKTGGDTSKTEYQHLDFSKLSVDDLLMEIAQFNDGSITVFDVVREIKREPDNLKEFRELLEKVSHRHILGRYAKEQKSEDRPDVQQEIDEMKNSLLRSIIYQRKVNDVVKTHLDTIKTQHDIPTANRAKYLQQKQRELEKIVKDKFENQLLEKYKFAFVRKNFDKALYKAHKMKLEQNQKKLTKN